MLIFYDFLESKVTFFIHCVTMAVNNSSTMRRMALCLDVATLSIKPCDVSHGFMYEGPRYCFLCLGPFLPISTFASSSRLGGLYLRRIFTFILIPPVPKYLPDPGTLRRQVISIVAYRVKSILKIGHKICA